MEIIDKAAAIASLRHCRRPIVTASVDSLDFIHPVKLGDILQVLAQVNAVWTSSMEVGVKVFSEQPRTGARTLTCTAYVTTVALGDDGRPARGLVPPLVARTAIEKRRQREAETRRRRRLEHAGPRGRRP
jgi:acyl-CoA hydrolase